MNESCNLMGCVKIMEVQPKQVKTYLKPDGTSPFEEWLDAFQDIRGVSLIKKRLRRVELGNLGDYRSVGEGVYEFRIDYGSGYRIYFGQIGLTVVLLLCGGDKSSQKEDIKKAKKYWRNYEQTESSHK
jgi:putative addiction module killer protein